MLPLVKHVHFGDGMLTRPCPDQNVAITYGQMDDLLKLCDLVAQVMAGCSPDIKRLCDEILASCAESRQIYIESKTEGRGKPWDAKCRTASSRSFVNQFRVSTRNVRRPIGDVSLVPTSSIAEADMSCRLQLMLGLSRSAPHSII